MFAAIKHKLMYPLEGKLQRLLDNDITPWYIFHDHLDLLVDAKYQAVKRNGSCHIVDINTLTWFEQEDFNRLDAVGKNELILWQNDTLTEYNPSVDLMDMGIIFKKPKQGNIEDDMTKGLYLIRTVICNNDNDINIVYSGTSFINYGAKISALKWPTASHMNQDVNDENNALKKALSGISSCVNLIANYLKEFPILDFIFLIDGDEPKLFSLKSDKDDIDLIKKNKCFKSAITKKYEEYQFLPFVSTFGFNILKSFFNYYAEKRGYQGFMLKNWYRDLIRDWKYLKRYNFSEIYAAHKNGFMSYRITQYSLNRSNYKKYLSDREYRWLRPINNDSLKFVYDKVIFRYVMDKYHEYLPKYFFHILNEKEKRIVRLPDINEEYTEDLMGVLNLIKDFKKVILKPTEGSHGSGIHILEYRDGYVLDYKNVSEADIIELLINKKKNYYISEYIEMHDFFKKIYDQTSCSIRLMVINKNGISPLIDDAYLRIPTRNAAKTDNISKGGISVAIDIESGKMFRPEIISDHIITMCEYHPITSKEIRGKIPNWDLVKDGVTRISKFLFQLEYMGIDIIITEDGFKIIEINTHQDLHRYPYYSNDVKEYLKRKVEIKKYENIL